MSKKLAILCLATSWIAQIIPACSRELTMCDGFRWGTDLQAHFPGYKIAICINGMFPSRMAVYKDSDITSQVGMRILALEEVTPLAKGNLLSLSGNRLMDFSTRLKMEQRCTNY